MYLLLFSSLLSPQLIPDDMEFQAGDMPNYTTSDGSVKIQKECEVRLKIIGTRVDATAIVCTISSITLVTIQLIVFRLFLSIYTFVF
jgi:DNA-directed RNA polymerase subunit E'/Rpb7